MLLDLMVTRVRQTLQLVRPTAKAMSWRPVIWAAVLAIAYVWKEAPGAYIDYRVLVLRVVALLVCMGAAFVLDDATEDTISHVPSPLLLRRALRVALLLPLVAATWFLLVYLAGDVAPRDGGPVPVGDITLEAATLLATALAAACIGARVTSDRLGGVAAAPILMAVVAAVLFLPGNYKLIVSVGDPRWANVHDTWRTALTVAVVIFVYVNRSPGAYRTMSRLRALRPASRPI
jgi:fluoroquinolone transport system permease protein